MGMNMRVSKEFVLEIYGLYAERYRCMAKAMEEDCTTLDANGYTKKTNEYWEQSIYIQQKIQEKLDELRDDGKGLVAYKIEYALPLAIISPSMLLKVLEVCGVEYDD